MSTGSGSSRGSRHGSSLYSSQVAVNALSNPPRVSRASAVPPQQTPTPAQASVSVSPFISSASPMGSSINPTSSLLVSQLLVGSASSVADPGAAATPFGMIVVGDGTVQDEIVEKRNEGAAATGRDSITKLEETRESRDTSEMVESGGMAFPTVPGYEDLRPVYSINYIQVFRAKSISTGAPVVLKLCTVNHLDTLARLRHEWKLLSEANIDSPRGPVHSPSTAPAGVTPNTNNSGLNSQPLTSASLTSLPGVVRAFAWEYLPDGGMALVYNDEPTHMTVREMFLPDTLPLYVGTSGQAMPVSPRPVVAKPRTQSDLIKILSVFSDVVHILAIAHKAGITHNNVNTYSIVVSKTPKTMGAGAPMLGKLGGWHLASRLEREDPGRAEGTMLRGLNPAPLQYIAPECTGRMNRTIDYRADFYSLGVSLYELVVGFLPFRSADPLELIHQHIAQQPVPPTEVNASIPTAVSAMVMKLLAKNAEDRYQIASGLKADIDMLIRRMTEGRSLDGMRVGELDTTSQFVITENLYGREEAVSILKGAYEKCSNQGGCGMVMVRGGSGVGKSRLVNEIQRPVAENRGYFTSGKFDQYKRGFSFFTLVQTLQDLVRQVLSESTQSLSRWRTETIRALDADAAVLVDVIPELKLLLGPDYKFEPLANLGPVERENRFREVIGRFLAVFGRRGLVVFLDDLQWCSQSELVFIAGIADEANRKMREWRSEAMSVGDTAVVGKWGIKQSRKPGAWGLLIIGTYRDNEIDQDHPLPPMLEYVQTRAGVEVVDIELGPLDQGSVRKIIGDTLHRDPDYGRLNEDAEMQTLTELVYAKTCGNAFFVMQLLKSLHRGGYIVFDFGAKGGGQWRFNLTSIEADDLPPTVVDLLVKQMLKLSGPTRTAMMLAACIGTDNVGLQSLAVAAGKKPGGMANDLWGALDAGLLLPTGGNYEIPLALGEGSPVHGGGGSNTIISNGPSGDSYFLARFSPSPSDQEGAVTYKFLHDRVQQAAYSLIPKNERAGVHRMVGARLLEKVPEEDLDGMLYEIVNQLNHWLSPLERDERHTLMELNLRAGKKAIAATAFDAALSYFLTAKQLLDDREKEEEVAGAAIAKLRKRISLGWETRPGAVPDKEPDMEDLILEINLSLIEGYFAHQKYEESINLADAVLPKCTKPRDKIRCLVYKMSCLLVQGKLNETIETGLLGLGVLNWEVPLDDAEAKSHADMMRPRILMDVAQIEALEKMRRLKDENLILLQELISSLLLPIYMSRPALLEAVCFTSVAITLEFGISTAGAYPMLMTGVILSAEGTQEAHLKSYAYGRLAINLIEKDTIMCPAAPAIYEVYAGHIGVFHCSMNEVLKSLHQAVTAGIALFNVDYTVFAMISSPSFKTRADSRRAEIPSFGMFGGEDLSAVHSKMVATKPSIRKFKQLTGMWWLSLPLQFLLNLRGLGNPDPLCFEGEELGDSKSLSKLLSSESMSHIYLYHMYRLIIAVIYGRYDIAADLATHYCEPMSGGVTGTFYASLTYFYSSVAFLHLYDTISDEQKDFLDRNIKQIKIWSTTAKGTFLHKSVFLEAEFTRVREPSQQLEILDKYDHAISLATSSGFIHDAAFISERCGSWLRVFSKRRAVPYLREAVRGYAAWGATNKAMELRKESTEDPAIKGHAESRPTMARVDSDMATALMNNAVINISPRLSPQSSRIYASDYGFDHTSPQNNSPSLASSRELFAPDPHDDDATSHASSRRENEPSSLGSELDFRTVLKASLVISEGIHLEEVIGKLMKSVLQTAGADYGVLILKEGENLHVETVGLLDQISILEHEPLNTRADLVPVSIVNIVASLGEQILKDSDDPKFDATYGRDSYFQRQRAKSVLCMPIQNQLNTMGVLYLENKLVNHAFTRQRQELLNVLCTQAAVTIDKARLYRQMELAKKAAEEATAEKSSFLANMSHEIRRFTKDPAFERVLIAVGTPFNALLSCSIFLLDTTLSEQQREYVETIRNSAVLTLQIIDGILDFSKIEHGAIDLQVSPFSLRDCIESALQLVAEPAATKDLELAFRNKCSNVDTVLGDITRFRQCVINLIGNAVKFTQAGHILVTTEAQKLPNSELWRVEVAVHDTGIGIPENARDRLFRAFSQVDTSTRRTYGGTGLGLAISKKLAEMMGGNIWFESEEGAGSTFHLTITAEVTERTWCADKRLIGKKAIVADTHPLSSNILADELEVEGLMVTRTNTAEATLKQLHDHGIGYYEFALIDLSVDKTCLLVDRVNKFDHKIRVIMMSRFGVSLPSDAQAYNIALSFARPAPRGRYVQAIHDAINPNKKKHLMPSKNQEMELLRSLARRHPLNILLAEDNPVNTRVALQHLKRMGYSAKHAKDGIEVLEMCEDAAESGDMFDVILMDIQMPRADGIETSLELRRRYVDGEKPTIIALTANATAADRERCQQAGMFSHIAKPILPNDLATALMSTSPLQLSAIKRQD
ncbi:unnamed protein product [Tuber aestivum]|uniref:Uncharacterized protein n=1 Tax=Tuber aestivum TaxID=59557 RepID=A0A292Q5E7_9PEZI|nr:unnamed protein product [Tuber aestivum]